METPRRPLDRACLEETLALVLDQAMPACAGIDYRLVGTAAALLQGVELPAADVDILVRERAAVDAFSGALAPFACLVAPAWLPDTCQYYASYLVNGVEVEFSTVEVETAADTVETFGRGPWEHFVRIPCGRYEVPAVALELRLLTELYRERPDRSGPILRHLQAHGCDLALVERGLGAIGLPQAAREEVLRDLVGKR